ncbi:kinase-like domain-containing protein [Aspergillus californicus]
MICPWLKYTTSIEQPTHQNIISVGQFAIVHKVNPKIVRKVPSDKSDIYSVQAFEIEAKIYGHLGRHRRIARCIRCADDYIALRCETNGNLETYLRENPSSDALRHRLARQAVEAVVYIHKKRVIHSDLAARQFLVDRNRNIRLSDFGGSSLNGSDAIAMENATHFLPRDEEVQILYKAIYLPWVQPSMKYLSAGNLTME